MNRRLHPAIVVSVILVITAVIYLPGLGSRFLLDDYYNLHDLDLVDNYGYGAYVFGSGFAGPSGRPLSLLSFALQHEHWPDNPAAFKAVNIVLHLVNGLLVFILCQMLAGLVTRERHRRLLWSLLVMILWLLHPMQVSTTLYTVQRMTQIATLFTLLGVTGYLHFRLPILADETRWRQLLILSCITVLCTILAFLAKENGILLPLYLLIIESTLLANRPRNKRLVAWKFIFLLLPALLLIGYLATGFADVYRSFQSQGYSMLQKILTESVVLTDYMRNITIPRPSVFGLYHDDYPVSQNLLTPPATLLAVIFLFCLIWLAFKKRKLQPVLSFSIFWFLGGHLLESTYFNLELYFEHRNYLPSFGLYFLLAWLVTRAADIITRQWLIYLAAGIYCLMVVTVARLEINVWAKPGIQTMEWARRYPRSERAIQDLLQFNMINNDYENAEHTINRLENLATGRIYPYLNKIYIEGCRLQHQISATEWDNYIELAGQAKPDKFKSVVILDQLIINILRGSCKTLEPDRLMELIKRLTENPEFSYTGNYLYEYLSTLFLYSGDLQNGLKYIRLSLEKEYNVPRKLREINLLYQMGEKEMALAARKELLEHVQNSYSLRLGYGRMMASLQL